MAFFVWKIVFVSIVLFGLFAGYQVVRAFLEKNEDENNQDDDWGLF